MLRGLADQHPLGHTGQPQVIAEVIAFLASPESYMTGTPVFVDRGFTAQ
jgi:NAD(P)-dependent dehydrogenase (short-subunit alcohol dehydrogenase family)